MKNGLREDRRRSPFEARGEKFLRLNQFVVEVAAAGIQIMSNAVLTDAAP